MTLQELKNAKATCEQLLSERESNEKEVIETLCKNKLLKSEMTELHNQLLDTVGDRDRLQNEVEQFDRCRREYEAALARATALEAALGAARDQLELLQRADDERRSSRTRALYDELVGAGAGPAVDSVTSPVTIDLTADDSSSSSSHYNTGAVISGSNKIKKYVKINRYIKKTRMLIKRNSTFCKNIMHTKERVRLVNELNCCNSALVHSREKYECETRLLRSEIDSLNESLATISKKYETSQREIGEHILAMDNLLEMTKYNAERFDSLMNNHQCSCLSRSASTSPPARDVTRSPAQALRPPIPPPAPCNNGSLSIETLSNTSFLLDNNIDSKPNIVMYSDEIGSSLGARLSQYMDHPIINTCMPGANYFDIMKQVVSRRYRPNTILIVLIGRRDSACEKTVVKYFSRLSKLKNVAKIVTFAFPFCQKYSADENKIRHNINMKLHTLVCRNSKKFHMIDLNVLFNNNCLYLTRGRYYYLSRFYKRLVAEKLSYYINSLVNLMTRNNISDSTNALIEQSQSDEIISNNLN